MIRRMLSMRGSQIGRKIVQSTMVTLPKDSRPRTARLAGWCTSSLKTGKPSELFGQAMVRPSGVEPPLLSEHGPEPCASANSATGAPWIQPGFVRRLGRREIGRPVGVVNDHG